MDLSGCNGAVAGRDCVALGGNGLRARGGPLFWGGAARNVLGLKFPIMKLSGEKC